MASWNCPLRLPAIPDSSFRGRRGALSTRTVAARPTRSPQVRQVIGELDELGIVERLQHLEHDRLVRVPRSAFVVAQGLEQIVLTLVGEPRHRLLTGKIRAVARIAVVLL